MKRLIPVLFVAGLISAQSVFAQGNDRLEIRGAVVESGVGVGGATVTLYEFGHTPPEATTRTVFAITTTDSKGVFQFHPARTGEYYVEAQKEGYFAESFDGPTVDPADSVGDPVSLNLAHPSQDRRFTMMRLGELRGRVLDEDGKPLAKLRVALRPGTIQQVVTDQDGYFVATKLRPDDYLVAIVPQQNSFEIQPQFSDADLKIVDQDLAMSFWPGGGDERSASPLPVRSGASLNVGNIVARKASYYRARLLVQGADCSPGEKWTFSTAPEMAGFGPQVPCAKEFLVRNLAPGSYTFVLSTNRRGEQRRLATAPVEVRDQNQEVAMTMSAGVNINGRLMAAAGTTLPSSKITVSVTPELARIGFSSSVSGGKFVITGLPEGRSRVSINGVGGKFYMKEIRYDGVTAVDGMITANSGGPAQLEIVIDDKAATITGSVADTGGNTGPVLIVVVRWPESPEDARGTTFRPEALVEADDNRGFTFDGLEPGEYRILAVAQDRMSRLQRDIVSRAERVTLEPGRSQSVIVKIVEP